MPLFDYLCEKCGYKKEVLESSNSNTTIQCVPCKEVMKKQLSTSNFQFRGSGFYENDYKRKT